MNQRPKNLLWQAVACIVARNVMRFRVLNAVVLVALAVAVIVAVACPDWLPQWLVYSLVAALVLAALGHARLNRAFEAGQMEVWERVFTLASSVEAKASTGPWRAPPQAKHAKSLPRNGPPLRLFRDDEDQSRKGS